MYTYPMIVSVSASPHTGCKSQPPYQVATLNFRRSTKLSILYRQANSRINNMTKTQYAAKALRMRPRLTKSLIAITEMITRGNTNARATPTGPRTVAISIIPITKKRIASNTIMLENLRLTFFLASSNVGLSFISHLSQHLSKQAFIPGTLANYHAYNVSCYRSRRMSMLKVPAYVGVYRDFRYAPASPSAGSPCSVSSSCCKLAI